MRIRMWWCLLATTVLTACGAGEHQEVGPDSFAFGVFGDGPYYAWEKGRYERLLEDVDAGDLEWFLHVGDLFWHPCTEEAYRERRGALNALRHPVFYTPGDNEWTDCHEERPGGWEPLGRLALLRSVFFEEPGMSLGVGRMAVETQSADPAFSEFVENVRWRFGGFVFATMHVVGSENGLNEFAGRGPEHDAEVARRTSAALAWMDATFEVAAVTGARGVVLAIHGNPGLERDGSMGRGFDRFVDGLEDRVKAFVGPVVLIHGDSHTQRLDQPLRDRVTGRVLENFTRIESFGSPDIGWTKIVVDTVTGAISHEPRLMRAWPL